MIEDAFIAVYIAIFHVLLCISQIFFSLVLKKLADNAGIAVVLAIEKYYCLNKSTGIIICFIFSSESLKQQCWHNFISKKWTNEFDVK